MTFELSAGHAAVRDQARELAQSLAARAAEIDRASLIPPDLLQQVTGSVPGDSLGLVVAIEEIGVASGALGVAAAAGSRANKVIALSGLRGAPLPEKSPRSQLVLAAVALGIGRAAVDLALAELRQAMAVPGADVEKPHWVVADVATELQAARLLTYKAAHTLADADIALARLMTSAAAARAVDAALRVTGTSALQEGHVLERLARDVRAVALILGTEEDQRTAAAEGLLPR